MCIAVFISGNGTNLQALLEYQLPIAFVASNNPNAYGLERAKKLGVPTYVEPTAKLRNFEKMVHEKCLDHGVKLIVLAGFMRILTPTFVNKWKDKIINIHPSLLPAFKGKTAIKDAYEYGVKMTGVTIHYVDQGMDTGRIIEQTAVHVLNSYSLEDLEKKIHEKEHILYPSITKMVYNQLTT